MQRILFSFEIWDLCDGLSRIKIPSHDFVYVTSSNLFSAVKWLLAMLISFSCFCTWLMTLCFMLRAPLKREMQIEIVIRFQFMNKSQSLAFILWNVDMRISWPLPKSLHFELYSLHAVNGMDHSITLADYALLDFAGTTQEWITGLIGNNQVTLAWWNPCTNDSVIPQFSGSANTENLSCYFGCFTWLS